MIQILVSSSAWSSIWPPSLLHSMVYRNGKLEIHVQDTNSIAHVKTISNVLYKVLMAMSSSRS